MDQNPSWEANQGTPLVLWNFKVSCSQEPAIGSYPWTSMIILSYHQRLNLPSVSFFHVSLSKLCVKRFSVMVATRTAHCILFIFIIWIILGEWYRLWSSVCSFIYLQYSSLHHILKSQWIFFPQQERLSFTLRNGGKEGKMFWSGTANG
jgi:hypothetical protein